MLIYDIEIRNAVPDRGGVRSPEVQYCEGWHDHKGMGIAVLGCYDYVQDGYRVFCQDNLSEFAALITRHDVVIGFNNLRFDNRVLAAHDIPINDAICYDLFINSARENPAFESGDESAVHARRRSQAAVSSYFSTQVCCSTRTSFVLQCSRLWR